MDSIQPDEAYAVSRNNRDFRDPQGADLLARVDDFQLWQQARSALGYWPYSRALEGAPHNTATIRDAQGLQQRDPL